MRTIDADRLKRSFEANTPIAFQDCVPGIHSVIDLEPTVEAEPVRHGHWTVTRWFVQCSECGEAFPLTPTNYCPNCGAKMDERKEK